MSAWLQVFVIGTDLHGRRCRVARIGVPASFTRAKALRYIRGIASEGAYGRIHYPYAVVDEIELDPPAAFAPEDQPWPDKLALAVAFLQQTYPECFAVPLERGVGPLGTEYAPGLLTGADGSAAALQACQQANAEDAERRDPVRAEAWAARDLDRLQFDGTWGSSI